MQNVKIKFNLTRSGGGAAAAAPLPDFLPSRPGQHIFDQDPISFGGLIDHHMGNCTHNPAILQDRRTAQECQYGTTHISIFSLAASISFLKFQVILI